MVPHSSTLAWQTPWMEEPGRLQSMGSLRVKTRLSDFTFTFMHWRRKWQPTPAFLPGESQGRGSLVGCCLWGHAQSRTRLKRLSSSSSIFFILQCTQNCIRTIPQQNRTVPQNNRTVPLFKTKLLNRVQIFFVIL